MAGLGAWKYEISSGDLQATVENGQLVSLKLKGQEFFHHGGSLEWRQQPKAGRRGWSNSEIVPFPIFGPTADYQVRVGDKTFTLDQHGISRSIPFSVVINRGNSITLAQHHIEGQPVENVKYAPDNGHPPHLDYLTHQIFKIFTLTPQHLRFWLTVCNNSQQVMPYRPGWHPAFVTQGRDGAFYDDHRNKIAELSEVIEASTRTPESAKLLEEVNSVVYLDRETGRGVRVYSPHLPHTMLWSPGEDAGMFCIEHTTHLPRIGDEKRYFDAGLEAEVLVPGERKGYLVMVEPFLNS